MKLKIISNRGGGKCVDTQQNTKRIEYIDAMRGFTIMLVVMTHVTYFGLGFQGSNVFSYSDVFKTFRMPLFFFVSGFVLYKADVIWDKSYIVKFLRKKITVQIITPFLFLSASVICWNGSLIETLLDYNKGGYWFTFTLFAYFILYIAAQQLIRLFRMNSSLEDIFLTGLGVIIYLTTSWPLLIKYGLCEGAAAFIGIPTMQTFLFFILGTRIKKHFRLFESLLDTKCFTAILLCFLLTLYFLPELNRYSSTLYNLATSISGVILVFALFRRYQNVFSSSTRLGRLMQFVGRRTLDIYLIHYFFIYSNLPSVLPNMAEKSSPYMEFLLALSLSIIIVASCLVVSAVLRLNLWLAHIMFGEKLKQDSQVGVAHTLKTKVVAE